MINWTIVAPAVSAAFLASIVEVVEAFTIVLAVATIRGWRPAILGTIAGLAVLAAIVVALGPVLDRVPLQALQLVIGILLLLFGLRWLRKAILRSAGSAARRGGGFRQRDSALAECEGRHITSGLAGRHRRL